MTTIFEFNLPGLPQVHMRIRVCNANNAEVSLRNDDRPSEQATLAIARARIADCYFSHDRLHPHYDNLWIGNTAFLVPVHEAEMLRKKSAIPMLQEVSLAQ